MTNFSALLRPVALEILGQPSEKRGLQWRYGTHGSLAVDLRAGVWHDHETNRGGGVLHLLKERLGLANGQAIAWLRERGLIDMEPALEARSRRRIVAAYDYRGTTGELLYQVVRYVPKDFRQRRPDGAGGWVWNVPATMRTLYRLPAVLSAVAARVTVFITEGEKGADAVAGLGLVATCSPGGAGKWLSRYSPLLDGADTIILPDNDPAGRAHGALVANSLTGIAARVRVLTLPGLPPKGDVFDWIEAGGTAAELRRLADAAPDWPAAEPTEPAVAASEGKQPPDWQQSLVRDERGAAIPMLANVTTALREAPELAGIISYDLMSRHALLDCTLPGSKMTPVTTSRPLDDADVTAIAEWLQRQGLRRIGKETVHDAVALVAREREFHPVRRYLGGLTWDGTPRLDRWLTYYLGAEPTPYTSAVGRMFLVSMAARIMRPGCKADHMLVLEGAQGSGKSTACSILAGPWFSDGLPDLHHSDAVRLSMHLRGKWLIEIAEMSSFGRAEAGALKAFLTQTEERFTPKYARGEVIEARQCVFVGTTNQAAYLRDETGGRRFWPVRTGQIDTQALAHDRDQIFAEAMTSFRSGERWWPDDDFERETILPEQENRYEVDAWEELTAVFLAGRATTTVADVARHGLFIETARLGTADQRRITAVLERLGWARAPRGRNGERLWAPRHD